MNTKKYILFAIIVGLFLTACNDIERDNPLDGKNTENNVQIMYLYGKWEPKSGTSMYFRYDKNGEGVTWNPKVDQMEEEGQRFTWELVQLELTQIHFMEIGGIGIPKIYTVTELTETTLRYKDSFSSYSFSKMD